MLPYTARCTHEAFTAFWMRLTLQVHPEPSVGLCEPLHWPLRVQCHTEAARVADKSMWLKTRGGFYQWADWSIAYSQFRSGVPVAVQQVRQLRDKTRSVFPELIGDMLATDGAVGSWAVTVRGAILCRAVPHPTTTEITQ